MLATFNDYLRSFLTCDAQISYKTNTVDRSVCGVSQCKTCKFIDSFTTISAPKSTISIQHHLPCTSSHLIYCISCSRSGMLYIAFNGSVHAISYLINNNFYYSYSRSTPFYMHSRKIIFVIRPHIKSKKEFPSHVVFLKFT